MAGSTDRSPRLASELASGVAVLVAYTVTARAGLEVHPVGFATLVWPPTGIALFALWRWGVKLWPAIALGAFIADWWGGAPPAVAGAIAIGSTIAAVVGVLLLRRADFSPPLERMRDVLVLIGVALLTAAIAATIGVTAVATWNAAPSVVAVERMWVAWWLGDGMGGISIGSLLWVWMRRPLPTPTRRDLVDGVVMAVVAAAVVWLVFADRTSPRDSPLGWAFVIFPILTWSAVRFGPRGTATMLVFIEIIAVSRTVLGHGPFADVAVGRGLVFLQTFMGIVGTTTMVLAASVAERHRARRAAEASGEAAAFLARSSEILSTSLEVETTLGNIARLVVPRLADNCVIDLVQRDGEVRRVAEAAADPSREELLRRLRRFPPGPTRPSPVLQVLETGRTVYIATFDSAALAAITAGDEYTDIVKQIAPRSAVAVPMVARGQVIGCMTFGMAESGRTYEPSDLTLAEELGRRAGLAVENAQLVAESHAAEERARFAAERAQEAVRARDEFLSVASHELRTPLTSLALQVGSLRRAATRRIDLGPDRYASKLETIGRQVERLGGLIENLLDVSRVVAGRLHLEIEEIDLAELVGDVVDRFRDQISRAGCALELDLSAVCMGRWDRMRLEQIVTNLITNAMKYGAGRPIEVRLGCTDGVAELRVVDHGIGISAEDQARIFERFERAVSDRHYGGLGLGLWIAGQAVAAMGGSIHVSSRLGEGAEFKVVLPPGPSD